MKLSAVLLMVGLFAQNLLAVEGKQGHVLARFAENATENTSSKLFVYSKQALQKVRYQVGDGGPWVWMPYHSQNKGYYVYATNAAVNTSAGTTVKFCAQKQNRIEILDQLEVQATGDVAVSAVHEVKLPPPPAEALDMHTITYGSATVHPQVLAQARANYMARNRNMTHLGGGIVNTCFGRLAEGIGMGGTNCTTCVATNGTAAVGDGQAVSSGGQTYRCRLYNSPGTRHP